MKKADILRQAYDAFNKRDVDAVLALMTADVNWPNAIENTRLTGHVQVRAYWMGQFATVNPTVRPTSIEEAGPNQAVVHVHQVVRDLSGAVVVDQMIDHIYTFDGDLIARMEIRSADPS